MLLRYLSPLQDDPARFLAIAPLLFGMLGGALMIAITVHEFSHALLADRLGDPTARRLGRVSLNPRAHLDPAGTLLFLVVGFGWGKPVPVNPRFLGRGGYTSLASISLAGPGANLVTALAFALPIRLGVLPLSYTNLSPLSLRGGEEWLAFFFVQVIFLNLILAIFNLIPVAPLDGFKVALGLLPTAAAHRFARLEPYGPGILMSVIFADIFLDIGILRGIIFPLLDVLSRLLVGDALLL